MEKQWLKLGNQNFLIQFFYHNSLLNEYPEIISYIDEVSSKYEKSKVYKINSKTKINKLSNTDKNFLVYSLLSDHNEVIKFLNRLPVSKKDIFLIQIGGSLNSLENIKSIANKKFIINDVMLISNEYNKIKNFEQDFEANIEKLIESPCRCMIIDRDTINKPNFLLVTDDEIQDLEDELEKAKKEREMAKKKNKLEKQTKKTKRKIRELQGETPTGKEIAKEKIKVKIKESKEKWQTEESKEKRKVAKTKAKTVWKRIIEPIKEASSEIKADLGQSTSINRILRYDINFNDKKKAEIHLKLKSDEVVKILDRHDFAPGITQISPESYEILCSKIIKAKKSPFYQERPPVPVKEKNPPVPVKEKVDLEINKDVTITMNIEMKLDFDTILKKYQIVLLIYADYKKDYIAPAFKTEYKVITDEISYRMKM